MDLTLILVTVFSLGLAAVMSGVAWRAIGEERRRSDRRVAILASEMHPDQGPARAVALGNELFGAAARPAHESRRFGLALAAGVFIVATVAALAIVVTGHPRASAPVSGAAVRNIGTPAVEAPLELVALTHERDRVGLTVHGVVRNPAGAVAPSHLTAVVLLYNVEGAFIATGRAEVNGAALEPGGQGTFVVSFPSATDVARYRVSFRSDDHVVPHLDRRNSLPS
jgi:hypothetical protein